MLLNYVRKEAKKENQENLKSALDYFQKFKTLQEKEQEIKRCYYFKSLERVYKKEKANTEKQKIKVLEKLIKENYKNKLQKQFKRIQDAESLLSQKIKIKEIKIEIEWKANRIWGYNPSVEVNIYTNKYGYNEFNLTGYASGCGYDKRSSATASAFNKSKILIAYLYKAMNNALKNKSKLNYGVYGLTYLHFAGGVGYSCHDRILKEDLKFKNICYEETSKNFDFYKYTA